MRIVRMLLVSCHPSSTIRIFLITNHQPLFHICISLPVESAPFFIPSTSFCSLSLLVHLIPRTCRSRPARSRPASSVTRFCHCSTVSKILERLVLTRLRPHLLSSTNFSQYHSQRTGPGTVPGGNCTNGSPRRRLHCS